MKPKEAARDILELTGTACAYLAKESAGEGAGASEMLYLFWALGWGMGCIRKRVDGDPAKEVAKPSGSFDDSCLRIRIEDPCGHYSDCTDEGNGMLVNEVACLYLQK